MNGKTSTTRNIFSSTKRLDLADGTFVTFGPEIFPAPRSYEFGPLFAMHANEVRGQPFKLDYKRFEELERKGRLVWIVARDANQPIGYACAFWYRDLHFDERVGAEDLWFVLPIFRGRGIGRRLKVIEHEWLKANGCVRVYDNIRNAYDHPKLMAELGYEPWGTRWTKTF